MFDVLDGIFDFGKELLGDVVGGAVDLFFDDEDSKKSSSKKSQGFAQRLAKNQQQTYAHLRQKALQDRLKVGLAPSNITRKQPVSNTMQLAINRQKQLNERVRQEVGSTVAYYMNQQTMKGGFKQVATLDTNPTFKLGEFDPNAVSRIKVGV
jgi:hypothetical protein|tara:strand:+ start:722 stop:1177 length:456 start_codon:yes stop_codon:yes gene_type:complete